MPDRRHTMKMKFNIIIAIFCASALLFSCTTVWSQHRQRMDQIYAERLELLKQLPPNQRMQALESLDTPTRAGGYTSFTYTPTPQPQRGTITTIDPRTFLQHTTPYTITPRSAVPSVGYSFDRNGQLTSTIYADPWTVTFGNSNED